MDLSLSHRIHSGFVQALAVYRAHRWEKNRQKEEAKQTKIGKNRKIQLLPTFRQFSRSRGFLFSGWPKLLQQWIVGPRNRFGVHTLKWGHCCNLTCPSQESLQESHGLASVRFQNQRKTKGQQLKGKIVSEFFTLFHNFSHFFIIFLPGLSPSKQRVLAQGEQKRRKDNKKKRANRFCTLVVARLSSSYKSLRNFFETVIFQTLVYEVGVLPTTQRHRKNWSDPKVTQSDSRGPTPKWPKDDSKVTPDPMF